MSLYTAKKQFEENLKFFGNKDDEKHNLYAGLINITDALINIESDLVQIKSELRKS